MSCPTYNHLRDFLKAVAHFYSTPSIGILARLNDPYVWILVLLLLGVVLFELDELNIVNLLYVVGYRERIERTLAYRVVVVLHIDKESFLVRQVKVAFKLAIDLRREVALFRCNCYGLFSRGQLNLEF